LIDGEFPLSDREFARIRARVHAAAGISLSDAKRTMVVSRLSKILRTYSFASFAAYLDFLENEGSTRDAQDFINALTTNLTRFFREDHHFTHLVSYVGELVAHRPRIGTDGRPRLRIWSAGCSTGQEAYTIALCLLAAYPQLKYWDFKILATDIDTSVLGKAALGVYPAGELNGLSAERTALFERDGDGAIRIPAAARSLVSFKPLNLLSAWPMRGPFDAVFCRNVAIYFDRTTQAELFTRLGRILASGGYLYIGHSENVGAAGDGFRLVGKTIYQPRQPSRAKDAA
jgi:chemotaxis protein methyltransferase CheR